MDNVNSSWDSYRCLLCSVIVYCKCYYGDLWPHHALSVLGCGSAAHDSGGLYSYTKAVFTQKFFAFMYSQSVSGCSFCVFKFLCDTLKVNLSLPDILKAFVAALSFFSDSMIRDSRNSCKGTGGPLEQVRNETYNSSLLIFWSRVVKL